jgi:hypothetical protein
VWRKLEGAELDDMQLGGARNKFGAFVEIKSINKKLQREVARIERRLKEAVAELPSRQLTRSRVRSSPSSRTRCASYTTRRALQMTRIVRPP